MDEGSSNIVVDIEVHRDRAREASTVVMAVGVHMVQEQEQVPIIVGVAAATCGTLDRLGQG